MSIETELRDALVERAATVESTVADPYARVHAAVASNRRRRRAVAAASFVAVVALAVGVPTLTSRLGDGPGVTVPAARPSLPEAGSPVWRSIGSWPLRGGLADDRALVDAIETKLEGRAIFVEDVGATRLALVVLSDQLAVVAGPRGSDVESMSTTTTIPLSEVASDSLTLAGQGTLVILTTPDLRSADVSGTPTIALDGTVSRTWVPVPLTDGVGRSTAVPLTQVRVGETMGSPRFTFGEDDSRSAPPPCEDPCGADQLAAFEERVVDDEVARAMALESDRVQTRTTYRGEVPRDIAGRFVGGLPAGARTTAQVIVSTLPGGQTLRTVQIRTESPGQNSTFEAEHLNPIAAATADQRPVVISAPEKEGEGPLTLWVLAPGASQVRAASPQPSVWPSSGAVPVVDGVARIQLPVSMLTVEEQYSIEVLDSRGAVVGSFPTTSGNPGLGAS